MVYISETLRQEVFKRARGLCEYCQTRKIVVVYMEIDHIIPQSQGGETNSENLCLTCAGCNAFKQDAQTALDPQTEQEFPLFNPRKDKWEEHFRWSNDALYLLGLSPKGRATIERLKINREEIIESRRLWLEAGFHPPT